MPTTENPIAYADFYAKCAPRIGLDVERCANVTACDIAFITPDELEAVYTRDDSREDGMLSWRVDSALLEADFMGKACQIKTNGMYDWIRAMSRQWDRSRQGSQSKANGRLEYNPFVKMGRKRLINNEYWSSEFVADSKQAAKEVTNESGSTITVDTYKYNLLSQGSIPNSVQFFPAHMRIFMSSKNTSTGAWVITQFKVVAATQAADNKIEVEVYKADNTSQVHLPGAGSIPGETANVSTYGLVTRGTKNVSDYDHDCQAIPGLNTQQEAYFWVETTRFSTCENDLVRKYMNLIANGNPLYRKFYKVEEMEWNRQVIEDYQRRLAWSWWFGTASDSNQTEIAWPNLPKILIPTPTGISHAFAGECIGYRADAIGMIPQAAECGRITDYAGLPLSIPTLLEEIYSIVRVRKSNGVDARIVELHCSNFIANQIAQGFMRYYSMRSESLLRLNQDMASQYNQGPFGFGFRRIMLDYPDGVELRLVTHEFYDDWASAHNTANSTLAVQGNLAVIPDFSVMYMANIASNMKKNKTGNAQDLAVVDPEMACVMETPQLAWNHRSNTHTFVNECPDSMLVMTGFACDVPSHQTDTCPS